VVLHENRQAYDDSYVIVRLADLAQFIAKEKDNGKTD